MTVNRSWFKLTKTGDKEAVLLYKIVDPKFALVHPHEMSDSEIIELVYTFDRLSNHADFKVYDGDKIEFKGSLLAKFTRRI